MAGAVRVEGLRELKRALARIDAQLHDDLEHVMRDAGEPVRASAERLASANIPNIGDRWGGMRLGIARGGAMIYIAPKARRRSGSPRTNLAPLLLNRAMLPALDDNRDEVILRLERMLDRVILGF